MIGVMQIVFKLLTLILMIPFIVLYMKVMQDNAIPLNTENRFKMAY